MSCCEVETRTAGERSVTTTVPTQCLRSACTVPAQCVHSACAWATQGRMARSTAKPSLSCVCGPKPDAPDLQSWRHRSLLPVQGAHQAQGDTGKPTERTNQTRKTEQRGRRRAEPCLGDSKKPRLDFCRGRELQLGERGEHAGRQRERGKLDRREEAVLHHSLLCLRLLRLLLVVGAPCRTPDPLALLAWGRC